MVLPFIRHAVHPFIRHQCPGTQKVFIQPVVCKDLFKWQAPCATLLLYV